jgi:hypothetical protein
MRSVSFSRSRLALGRAPLWHSVQYFSMIAGGAADPACGDAVACDANGFGCAVLGAAAGANGDSAARGDELRPDCAERTETSAQTATAPTKGAE